MMLGPCGARHPERSRTCQGQVQTGFGGRLLLLILVWLFGPRWLHASATLHWPQGSFRTFVALFILLLVAQTPVRARRHRAPFDVESGAGRVAKIVTLPCAKCVVTDVQILGSGDLAPRRSLGIE